METEKARDTPTLTVAVQTKHTSVTHTRTTVSIATVRWGQRNQERQRGGTPKEPRSLVVFTRQISNIPDCLCVSVYITSDIHTQHLCVRAYMFVCQCVYRLRVRVYMFVCQCIYCLCVSVYIICASVCICLCVSVYIVCASVCICLCVSV